MTGRTQELLPHRIRPAVDADVALVTNAWVQEFRHAPAARFIRNADYYADQRTLIYRLLRASETLVACAPDDENHLFGFVTFGPGMLVHWVYVKDSYRRIGLGDALLEAAFPGRDIAATPLFATHAGRNWEQLEPPLSREERSRAKASGRIEPESKGALSRRGIFFRPYLLERLLSSARAA